MKEEKKIKYYYYLKLGLDSAILIGKKGAFK